MDEKDKLIWQLKKALASAMFNDHRIVKHCVDCDPAAGSTYEIDWTDSMKTWAKLADVDLAQHALFSFFRP